MTAAALGQLPSEKRLEFGPLIHDVSLKFLNPDAFSRQVKAYFARHYDGKKMAMLLALERTTTYRSMHRIEAEAEAANAMTRHRFETNLKTDPPPPARVRLMQRLDDTMNTTELQVKIVTGILKILNAVSQGSDLQTADFTAKIRPVLAGNVLVHSLFTYRNAEDAELEDYLEACQQPPIVWFNRMLHDAIVAVAAERAAQAGEDLKGKQEHPFN